MIWELHSVKDVECTMDNSGIYTVINRTPGDDIRLDVMDSTENEAVQSFQGTANAVRKHSMKWLFDHCLIISTEHASYIGYELARAESDDNYVQDKGVL